MTDTTVTCPDCQLSWHVNIQQRQASPGRRVPERVQVPRVDIYGDRTGGSHWEDSSFWMSEGATVQTVRRHHASEPVTIDAWACQCGAGLTYQRPRLEHVRCTYGTQEGVCESARWGERVNYRTNRPDCPCCRLTGVHWVRVDGVDLPLCQAQ